MKTSICNLKKLCRKLLLALLTVGLCASAWAADQYSCSVLLDPDLGDMNIKRNWIYSYSHSQKTLVPFNSRIEDALRAKMNDAGLTGDTPLVVGLSMGLSGIQYTLPHGALIWGIAPRTKLDGTAGLYGSDLHKEPVSEAHADLYVSVNIPNNSTDFDKPDINKKVVEENSDKLPNQSSLLLPIKSFGIKGTKTGSPFTTGDAPETIGFDANLASTTGNIYFVIQSKLSGTDGSGVSFTYQTSDILMLDKYNNISIWASAGTNSGDILIDIDDKINSLCVCAGATAAGLGVEDNFLFTIGPDSPSLNKADGTDIDNLLIDRAVTSADILHFVKDANISDRNPLILWKSAPSLGLTLSSSKPIVITEIESIDPAQFAPGEAYEENYSGIDLEYHTSENGVVLSECDAFPAMSNTFVFFEFEYSTEVHPANLPADPQTDRMTLLLDLAEGESQLLQIHFIHKDTGLPTTFSQVFTREALPETNTHAADYIHAVHRPSTNSARIKIVNPNVQTTDARWEFFLGEDHVGGLDAQLGNQGPVTFDILNLNSYDSGIRLVRVELVEHGLDSNNNIIEIARSKSLTTSFYQDSTVPACTNLSLRRAEGIFLHPVGGPTGSMSISWITPSNTNASYQLKLNDGATTDTYNLTGNRFQLGGLHRGFYKVSIRSIINNEYSEPLEGSFFIGIEQFINPVRSIDLLGTGALPSDLAYINSNSDLIVTDRSQLGNAWRISTLDRNSPPACASVRPAALASNAEILGICTSFIQKQDTRIEVLVWSVSEPSLRGAPKNRLIVTKTKATLPADDRYEVLENVLVNGLPAGSTTPQSLTYDARHGGFLLTSSSQTYSIPDFLGDPSINQVLATQITQVSSNQQFVSNRAFGYSSFLSGTASTINNTNNDFSTYALNNGVIAEVCSLSLNSTADGIAFGGAHAEGPIPHLYVAGENEIRVNRVPATIEKR